MSFADLRLAAPLLQALSTEGYTTPTPIQTQAIPLILDGRDLLGSAQTGTGKTAAFALPVLQCLAESRPANGPRRPRGLVLCPTRELATQISQSFATYGRHLPLRGTTIYGGVGQHRQVQALRSGVDILVATPGRLMDLMEQGHVDLRAIQVVVLDEADRMLDMGFIHDIRRIAADLPAQRQTLMFSATMPKPIRQLADTLLKQPATVQIAAATPTADGIEQSVYHVEPADKPALLAHLIRVLPMARAIVFTRTKHGADKVVKQLQTRGIESAAIHGNKNQAARERALAAFRGSRTPVLVATDVASRGIDVDGITHVVNYDLTHEPETYVHRIGRTARAGAQGAAVAFCSRAEQSYLRAIERLLKRSIPIKADQPPHEERPVSTAPPSTPPHRREVQPGGHPDAFRPRHHAGPSARPTGHSPRPHAGKPRHAAQDGPGHPHRHAAQGGRPAQRGWQGPGGPRQNRSRADHHAGR